MSKVAKRQWRHGGFEPFSQGRFEDGGSNLYVNAKGIIETIHRTDVNNDGYVDIILPNGHGYIERGPTWIYKQTAGPGKDWPRQELANDSGWMSRIADVDGDGYPDLIVVNGENGVTSELDSYVYWGGPEGLTGERTELPTAGAYDVAVLDVNRDGRLDLIFPSAWVDHHNPGRPRLLHVYVQTGPRRFEDASRRYGLTGMAATSVACGDLTGDGRDDLVVANFRKEFVRDTDSYVYWAAEDGFDAADPLRLPTHAAQQVLLADLNADGFKEIIFCGGDEVWIYWNEKGTFAPERRTMIKTKGLTTAFCVGAVRAAVADLDSDGSSALVLATEEGVEIRASSDLQTVRTLLPLPYASWVCTADLDGDGRLEIIASKYDDRVTYETESAVFWNGAEGFSPDRVRRIPTTGAMGCTAGDLDGDGKAEVVFNNTMRGPSQFNENFPVYVYLGGKDADYGRHRRLELPVNFGSSGYVLADLNLDGYPDLVVTMFGGLRIFSGGPDGLQPDRYVDLLDRPVRPVPDRIVMNVLVADFNRDGYLDLLALILSYDKTPEKMTYASIIFYGSADGFSPDRSHYVPTCSPGQAILADVNQDGYVDLITGDERGYITIYLGGPQGFSLDRVWQIPVDYSVCCINVADLNENGWLDLVVTAASHYEREIETFFIYRGGPNGFDPKPAQCYAGRYTPGPIAVADVNNNGHLDLLVPAYSTDLTRVLPAQLFPGDGRTVDLEHPVDVPAKSSFAFFPMDLSRNGYVDLVMVCHRDDLGHQVDSVIFWNGPEGISADRTTRLPGMGPHFLSSRDPGNAYTRRPVENYISPPFDLDGARPVRIEWDAELPVDTELKFQIRWAASEAGLDGAPWHGPQGERTYYRCPGRDLRGVPPSARWLQYRAAFVSLYGCASPRLREVRIDLT